MFRAIRESPLQYLNQIRRDFVGDSVPDIPIAQIEFRAKIAELHVYQPLQRIK